jgi:hypothetical protein
MPLTGSLLIKSFGASHHSLLSASTTWRYENTLGATRAELAEDDTESSAGRGYLTSKNALLGRPSADCLIGGVLTETASL